MPVDGARRIGAGHHDVRYSVRRIANTDLITGGQHGWRGRPRRRLRGIPALRWRGGLASVT